MQDRENMVDEVEDLVQEASTFLEGATIDTRSVALSYWTMFELVPGQRKTSASKNVGILSTVVLEVINNAN